MSFSSNQGVKVLTHLRQVSSVASCPEIFEFMLQKNQRNNLNPVQFCFDPVQTVTQEPDRPLDRSESTGSVCPLEETWTLWRSRTLWRRETRTLWRRVGPQLGAVQWSFCLGQQTLVVGHLNSLLLNVGQNVHRPTGDVQVAPSVPSVLSC